MKFSLFIGRWQVPERLHKGHQKLISKASDVPLIAIRKTPKNKKNPYSVEERFKIISNTYPIKNPKIQYLKLITGNNIAIMEIPDISEVCYGRGVGYKVKKIKLPERLESISATDIREARIAEQN